MVGLCRLGYEDKEPVAVKSGNQQEERHTEPEGGSGPAGPERCDWYFVRGVWEPKETWVEMAGIGGGFRGWEQPEARPEGRHDEGRVWGDQEGQGGEGSAGKDGGKVRGG